MAEALKDASHARLMDGIYKRQRLIYDATRKYYLLGRDQLIDELDVPRGGTVLEMACGTGRNLAKIARHYPDCALYGADISSEMLISAQKAADREGLGDRMHLAEGDATAFDSEAVFGQADFDRVVLSYSLSMIPDWRGALTQALALTKPGGSLHMVDFGEQAQLPGAFRSVLQAWLARFHVAPRAELEEELQALAATSGSTLRFTSLYRDYSRYAVLTRPL